ncbi:hypothetical protein O0L34_g14933 [Tuta absoluta]|nr:hypothetical protein O0L34_g14933 [Tuta absoluta]
MASMPSELWIKTESSEADQEKTDLNDCNSLVTHPQSETAEHATPISKTENNRKKDLHDDVKPGTSQKIEDIVKCELELEELPDLNTVSVKNDPDLPSQPHTSCEETSAEDSRLELHSEVDIKFELEEEEESKVDSQDDDNKCIDEQNGAQMGHSSSPVCPGKKARRYKYNCSVFGCLNTTDDRHLTFFRFPNDIQSRNMWLNLIDRADSKWTTRFRVCSVHFDPESIIKEPLRNILKKNSVPKLLLPAGVHKDKDTQTTNEATHSCIQTDNYQRHYSTQTPDYLFVNTGKRKPSEPIEGKKRFKTSNAPDTEIDVFQKLCDKFLNKNLSKVVKEQARLKCQYSRNRYSAYSIDYKMFCLNLFYTSPQAYDLLSESLLNMPSISTLKKMYVPIRTDVNSHIMEVLETKTSRMTDIEKHCSLVIESINLRANLFYNIKEDKIYGFQEIDGIQSPEPAKSALVAMVHGVFTDYKQPVGFALLSDCNNYEEVSKWIDKLIKKLFEIGLKIRVLNVGSDFTRIAKEKKVTIEKPYSSIGSHKIYHIFDSSHLIKSVRDNLMNYDFHFGSCVAKWDHITQLYEKDKTQQISGIGLAPGLTESHIGPSNFERTKVKLAVETLSTTVATGLSTCRDLGELDSTAEGTIKLLTMMNNLFDILNSSVRVGSTEYQNAFSGSVLQISFINEIMDLFANLKLIDPKTGEDATARVKFVEGVQITLKSILRLFKNLQSEGFSYIMTRRLNQDCMERFFGRVCTRKGKSTKPTSWQLVSAFRKLFLMCIIKNSKQGNCSDDLSDVLHEGCNFYAKLTSDEQQATSSEQVGNHSEVSRQDNTRTTISTMDYSALDFPEQNALAPGTIYLCDYFSASHVVFQIILPAVIAEKITAEVEAIKLVLHERLIQEKGKGLT